jgi:hypothetical protein
MAKKEKIEVTGWTPPDYNVSKDSRESVIEHRIFNISKDAIELIMDAIEEEELNTPLGQDILHKSYLPALDNLFYLQKRLSKLGISSIDTALLWSVFEAGMAYNMPAHIAGDIANVHIQGRAIKSTTKKNKEKQGSNDVIYALIRSKTQGKLTDDILDEVIEELELEYEDLLKERDRLRALVKRRDK